MTKLEEIEIAAEKLPIADFLKLALWVERRKRNLQRLNSANAVRTHSAFLSGYSAGDEGLYEDIASC